MDRGSPQEQPGPLSASVADACERLARQSGPATAAGLREISARLSGPLQLIVAGRVSAGKSTLVNALIGRRMAATSATETTLLPARYRYGPTDRVEPIGAPVRWLDVTVPVAALRSLTIIDTPGTGSVHRADPALVSTSADPALVGAGEAMLYVLNQTVRSDDAATLAAFTAAGGDVPGPCATIAVLSKADTVPGSVADHAARAAAALGHRVSGVLPVIGLLAESAETGRFDAADATALRRLAALGPELDVLTSSVDEFCERDLPVPAVDRRRLLERLDLAGTRYLTTELTTQPTLTVAELRRRLVEFSGLPALRTALRESLLDRADAVKAGAALRAITELCRPHPAERAAARDVVEELLARPESHRLRLLDVINSVSSGRVELAPELAVEVVALGGNAPPTTAEHALERAGWWRSYASFGATPDQARVAEIVHRAYFLQYQQLRREGRG